MDKATNSLTDRRPQDHSSQERHCEKEEEANKMALSYWKFNDFIDALKSRKENGITLFFWKSKMRNGKVLALSSSGMFVEKT